MEILALLGAEEQKNELDGLAIERLIVRARADDPDGQTEFENLRREYVGKGEAVFDGGGHKPLAADEAFGTGLGISNDAEQGKAAGHLGEKLVLGRRL